MPGKDARGGAPSASEFAYVWAWGPKYPRTLDRKGQECRMLVRGKMNSCLIEFLSDGWRVVTSRNALRKVKGNEQAAGPR